MDKRVRFRGAVAGLLGLAMAVGLMLALPFSSARAEGDRVEFRPRLDSVEEPVLPPPSADKPGSGADAGTDLVDAPSADWAWEYVLFWLALAGAGVGALGLLYREPAIQGAIAMLLVTGQKPGPVDTVESVPPDASDDPVLTLDGNTRYEGLDEQPWAAAPPREGAGIEVDHLTAAGFTDAAIRYHGAANLGAYLSALTQDGLSGERLDKEIQYMNTWADRALSGQADAERRFSDGAMSLGLSSVPVVGEIKDGQEVVTGVDYITGERLAGWERGVTIGALFLPFVGGKVVRGLIKRVRKLFGFGDGAAQLTRHTDEVAKTLSGATHVDETVGASTGILRAETELAEQTSTVTRAAETAGRAEGDVYAETVKAIPNPKGLRTISPRSKDETVELVTDLVGNPHPEWLDYRYAVARELDNFQPGYVVQTGSLQEDLVLVQFHADVPLGPRRSAKYWTTAEQANAFAVFEDYREYLALAPEWERQSGPRTVLSVARIPAGTQVTYIAGHASAQASEVLGRPLPGGGLQFLFPEFDPAWIVSTQKVVR